jgi:class 3 adenylate cyclase
MAALGAPTSIEHTGRVLHDYAALGSVTNLASRLSTHAAAGQILVGPRVFAAVEETVVTDPVGSLDLKGFGRPIPAYDVRGLRSAP